MAREISFDEKHLREFDYIAKTVFAPIYPVIAGQAIARTGKTQGRCVDLGSGPAYLALALAKSTELMVIALDFAEANYPICRKNIEEAGMTDRVYPLIGDVHEIPVRDGEVDLVVSRGSLFFWRDLTKVFNEVWRTLKKGGMTFIGGGFGNPELSKSIFEQMAVLDPDWQKERKCRLGEDNVARIKRAIADSKLLSAEVNQDETGFWIVARK
jgi:ubiquinone/menaquinone biosynthesis C-methylase UbiE